MEELALNTEHRWPIATIDGVVLLNLHRSEGEGTIILPDVFAKLTGLGIAAVEQVLELLRWIAEIQKLHFAALAAHAELRRGEGRLRQPLILPVQCSAWQFGHSTSIGPRLCFGMGS